MTAPVYPWLQEPLYEQGPMTGNAVMAWILSHAGDVYIDTTGNPQGALPGGTWVDDPSAPIVPPTGLQGQKFQPTDPTNPIWAAGTMYGKDGYDLWVQSDLCKEVIAYQQANPTPIPPAILNPPPPYTPPPVQPPPPPYSPNWFEAFIARMRQRF